MAANDTKTNWVANTAEREIVATRVFDASRARTPPPAFDEDGIGRLKSCRAMTVAASGQARYR